MRGPGAGEMEEWREMEGVSRMGDPGNSEGLTQGHSDPFTEVRTGCATACNRRKAAGAYRAALLFVCGSTSFMDWAIKSICFVCCCR
jgi:hypothetical protein